MWNWKSFLALGLLTVALAPAAAQQRAASSPALSALDYYEIQQLNARFCHALDSAAENGEMFAAMFTVDGVFVDAAGKSTQGHDQLAAYAREAADGDMRKGPTNISHYVTNMIADAAPGGANTKGYLLVVTPAQPPAAGAPAGRGRGPGRVVSDGGQYWDELVRTPAGWRIRKRTLVKPGTTMPAMAAKTAATTGSVAVADTPAAHPFTAREYADIYQLYARYGYAFDAGSEMGYGWANLYTPDGIHVNSGNVLEYLRGRDLIAAFAYGALRLQGGFASLVQGPGAGKNPLGIGHISTNVLLEPTAEGAASKVYRFTGAIAADGTANLNPGGIYYDRLAKTAEGWRFKESWYIPQNTMPPDGAQQFMPAHFGMGLPAVPERAALTSATESGLSADDDAEIRQLYARIAHAFDSGAENGNALARLFTADGVYVDPSGKATAGRDGLAALARGNAADGRGPANTGQWVYTIKMESTPRGASSKAYVVMGKLSDPGKPIALTSGGQYWDDWVKTPEGWRLARREFHSAPRAAGGGGPAGAPAGAQ